MESKSEIDFINDVITTGERLKENPTIAKKMKDKIIGFNKMPPNTMLAILNNNLLFTKICRRNEFKVFADINDALKTLADDELLVYFADLQLYVIMCSAKDFETFQCNAKEIVEDDDGTITVRQVVFSYQRQKLVFSVQNNSPEYIKKICNLAEKCLTYNVTSTILEDSAEITIENQFADHGQASECFHKLNDYIRLMMPELATSIGQLPIMVDSFRKYIMPDVSKTIIGDKWVNHLKHVPSNFDIKIEINMNNYNQCNFNNHYGGPSKKDVAEEWIKNNPPISGEKTTVYYDRYASVHKNPVANTIFGPIVTSVIGRKSTGGTGGVRHW